MAPAQKIVGGWSGAAAAAGALAQRGDLDPRQLLAVPGVALVAALGLELDHPQLGPALVGEDPGLDADVGQIVAVDDVGSVHEQERLQRHGGAVAQFLAQRAGEALQRALRDPLVGAGGGVGRGADDHDARAAAEVAE